MVNHTKHIYLNFSSADIFNSFTKMTNIYQEKARLPFQRAYLTFMALVIFIPAILFIFLRVNDFYKNHYFEPQLPLVIKFQNPLPIKTKETEATKPAVIEYPVIPSPTPKPKIPTVSEILPKIFQLESSSGRNDGCRDIGKFNGYGFMQSTFNWECFDTQEEVEVLVANWFTRHLEDKTLPEALCYYNRGVVEEGCPYYQNYLSLR